MYVRLDSRVIALLEIDEIRPTSARAVPYPISMSSLTQYQVLETRVEEPEFEEYIFRYLVKEVA